MKEINAVSAHIVGGNNKIQIVLYIPGGSILVNVGGMAGVTTVAVDKVFRLEESKAISINQLAIKEE